MMASCQYVERRVLVQVLIISVKRMESGENFHSKKKKEEICLSCFPMLLLLLFRISRLDFYFTSAVDGCENFV